MTRATPALLAALVVLAPAKVVPQNRARDSRLELSYSSQPCSNAAWCLSVQVVDGHSHRSIERALVSVVGCTSFLTDAAGRMEAACPQAGTPEVVVRAIGYLPTMALLRVELGETYAGTATLTPAGVDPDNDLFSIACSEWEAPPDQERCLEYELARARQRLGAALDTARTIVPRVELLDAAQGAWEAFVSAECAARASLEDDVQAARLAELRCVVDFTDDRAYRIEVLPYWRDRREPSNERLERSGASAGQTLEWLESS